MPSQGSLAEPSGFTELARAIESVKVAIWCVLTNIKEFKILDESLVPEGLKPIARSISWLVEQIVVQNLRAKGKNYGIASVKDPPHGLTQYDCVMRLDSNHRSYMVNVKTSLTITEDTGRFDISKGDKLIKLYESTPDLLLLVAIAKVEMNGVLVRFKDLIVFNVAWTPDIYYNRANHNLQSKCDGSQTPRTNEQFVVELRRQMQEAGHLKHY
jgi:hypothetical protein